MPTYEYVCLKCRHEFELYQPISDSALGTCPKDHCKLKSKWGRGKVQRKIGAGAGLIFKGSGFYITDYRSEGYKESAKKESAANAPAPAGEAKKGADGAASTSKAPEKSEKSEKSQSATKTPASKNPKKSTE